MSVIVCERSACVGMCVCDCICVVGKQTKYQNFKKVSATERGVLCHIFSACACNCYGNKMPVFFNCWHKIIDKVNARDRSD